MPRKIQVFNSELDWLSQLVEPLGIPDSVRVLRTLYNGFYNHFFPDPYRSTKEEREAAKVRIREWADSLEPDAEVTIEEGLAASGLPTDCHADRVWTGFVMRSPEVGLEASAAKGVTYKKPRLTNGNAAAGNNGTTSR